MTGASRAAADRTGFPRTLVDLLDLAATTDGRIVFVDDDDVLTFADLRAGADLTAGRLAAAGVAPGETVAMMLPNSRAFVETFFGIVRLGALPMPMSTDYRGEMLRRALEQAAPRLVAVAAGDLTDVPELAAVRTASVDDLAEGEASPARPAADDPAMLMLTSGTTSGRSKIVIHSNASATQWARATVRSMAYSSSDVIYTPMPLNHGAALMCDLFGAMATGASIAVARRFSASRYWRHIRDTAATVASTLGTVTQILVNTEYPQEDTEHQLRVIRRSGASAQLTREFEARFDVRTTEMYGLSDVGLITGLPSDLARIGSCGLLLDDWEAELRTPLGQPAPAGTPGELFVRPSATGRMPLGYLGADPPYLDAVVDGWFATGDILVRDGDGFYSYVGRAKDVIRRGGENVAPADVEFALATHPDVLEVAVYAVPGELGEDEVMACVVAAGTLDAASLRAHCAERLPYYSVPRFYRQVPGLPRTPTQKVQVQSLRADGITADTVDTGSTSRSALGGIAR